MVRTKLIIGIGVALLVTGGVGWVWGASGRADSSRALGIAELRAKLREGRAAVLDARLTSLGPEEDAKLLATALVRIDEAQRMAGQLNQNANAIAADAATTIDEVLGAIAER